MRKILFLAAMAAMSCHASSSAQTGPKMGKNGGIGSSSSTYSSGEPTGGTYAINGTTGKAATSGVDSNVPIPTFVTSGYNASNRLRQGSVDCGPLFTAAQGGLSGQSTADICYNVPNTVTTHQTNGLAVIGESLRAPNHATLDGDVGIYYQLTSKATGGNILGLNGVVQDTAGFTGQTIQNELDFNRNAADTSVVGIALTMNGPIAGPAGNGFLCRNPDFSATFWNTCFFSPGPANIALFAGTRRAGNNQPSQVIQLASTSAAGVTINSQIFGNAGGQLVARPDPDGNGATAFSIQNDSPANNTTKINILQFTNTDTISVQKPAASLVAVPLDANSSNVNLVANVRKGDAIALSGTFLPFAYRLDGTTFANLPTCNTTNQGAIAFITDASAVISAWNQSVTAGGGANKAFVKCNGTGWNAF